MGSDVDMNEVCTLTSTMTSLEKESLVPTITDLQALLKSAFSTMTKDDQYLYQSILMDIQVLQPWCRKLDYAEVKALTRMENLAKSKSKLVDLTNQDDGDSDDEGAFIKLSFQQIPQSLKQGKKTPIANVPSTPLTITAQVSTKTPQSKPSAQKSLGNDEEDIHRPMTDNVSSMITDNNEDFELTESDADSRNARKTSILDDNNQEDSDENDFEVIPKKGKTIHTF